MIVKERKVYYCEHCNKHGLSSGAMRKHETGCTLNPKRTCGLCGTTGYVSGNFDVAQIATELAETYKTRYEEYPAKIADLYEQVGHCPNCMFSLLRLAAKTLYPSSDLHDAWDLLYYTREYWDYRKELEQYWEQRNAELRDECYHEEYAAMLRAEGYR